MQLRYLKVYLQDCCFCNVAIWTGKTTLDWKRKQEKENILYKLKKFICKNYHYCNKIYEYVFTHIGTYRCHDLN